MWKNLSNGSPSPFGQKKSWGVRVPCTSVVCVYGVGGNEEVPKRALYRQGTSGGGDCSKYRQAIPGELSELTQGWNKIHEG